MPVKRILWPTDLSPLSIAAAGSVREFCDAFDAKLFVVCVCPSPVAPHIGSIPPPSVQLLMRPHELLGPAEAGLKTLIEEQFHSSRPGGHQIKHEALFGTPWLEVCNYSRDNKIDLIILATHGHTGMRHALLGSVAERIVQHAPCAVLVVKSKMNSAKKHRKAKAAAASRKK
jgi:universal stress protein A